MLKMGKGRPGQGQDLLLHRQEPGPGTCPRHRSGLLGGMWPPHPDQAEYLLTGKDFHLIHHDLCLIRVQFQAVRTRSIHNWGQASLQGLHSFLCWRWKGKTDTDDSQFQISRSSPPTASYRYSKSWACETPQGMEEPTGMKQPPQAVLSGHDSWERTRARVIKSPPIPKPKSLTRMILWSMVSKVDERYRKTNQQYTPLVGLS